MKKTIPLFFIVLFLTSCSETSAPTPVSQSIQIATPTPPGTWEMTIEGTIFDSFTGEPVSGATIHYIVVHSYYPEIQVDRPKYAVSNEQGRFRLPMIVHDTDTIKFQVEAIAYEPYKEKLDLFGNRNFDIKLIPSTTATAGSP